MVCPKCKDTGRYLYEDENGYVFSRECECGIYARKVMENRLKFANLPKIFESVRLDNFDKDIYSLSENKKLIEADINAIRYWIDNLDEMQSRGKGLYLYSNIKGSGKTRMAVSIANELMYEKKKQIKFATSMQIINEIKASWNGEGTEKITESQLLDYLITSEILFIDDFGTEQIRDWICEKFYHIINSRYIEHRPTIFTSNLPLNELQYDERIKNRILEMCFLLPFPEESIREHIADENRKEIAEHIR